MTYEQEQVLVAFAIYTRLARDGGTGKEDMVLYQSDDVIRVLLELYASKVDCIIMAAGDMLYMIPTAMKSPFHISNEELKKRYFQGSQTANVELYTMYLAALVLIGKFYDSYTTDNVTLDFLPIDEWLTSMDERMEAVREHGEEVLKEKEREHEYNWRKIIEKWEALNEIKESAKSQKGRTISKLSFLRKTAAFLQAQKLIEEVGPDEYVLTDKAMRIVQLYFMDMDYNRGILEFLYQEEADHA